MSAIIETLIMCDGGPETCPQSGAFCWGDMRDKTAKEQRAAAKSEGWIFRNGKDFCPECAVRLGLKRP